jgi:hypothetical protein
VPSFAPGFQLPTRLIYVNPDTQTLLQVLSADLQEPENCRYVALSHCWGGPEGTAVPKTLQETLNKHQKEGITGLTKTFEDAVKVTRRSKSDIFGSTHFVSSKKMKKILRRNAIG